MNENFLQITFPFADDYYTITDHVTEHVTDHVQKGLNDKVISLILMSNNEMSRNELMQLLQLNHRRYFITEFLQPAIEAGLLEMTIPDKPKSMHQKYRLTKSGQELKSRLKLLKNNDLGRENYE